MRDDGGRFIGGGSGLADAFLPGFSNSYIIKRYGTSCPLLILLLLSLLLLLLLFWLENTMYICITRVKTTVYNVI